MLIIVSCQDHRSFMLTLARLRLLNISNTNKEDITGVKKRNSVLIHLVVPIRNETKIFLVTEDMKLCVSKFKTVTEMDA